MRNREEKEEVNFYLLGIYYGTDTILSPLFRLSICIHDTTIQGRCNIPEEEINASEFMQLAQSQSSFP